MASKGKKAGVAVAVLAAIGVALWGASASAGQSENGDFDGPDDEGEPGRGKGGAPKPWPGGETWGTPGDASPYVVPEGWDPLRGLWISPDCELVVEAPGWACGLGGPSGDTPLPWGSNECHVEAGQSYEETMGVPRNGVFGYVDWLVELGMQPGEIAIQILAEISPLCADLPEEQWPDGLWAWYEGFLERVILWWEEWHGIEFDAEAA